MSQQTGQKTLPRWHERGWTSYKQAYAYFRQIVKLCVAAGLQPGQALPPLYNDALVWLIVECDTTDARLQAGIRFFTLFDNGRSSRDELAKYSFAAVDMNGVTHAFSLALALRAKRTPFYDVLVA